MYVNEGKKEGGNEVKKLLLLLLAVIMVSTLIAAPILSASPDKDVDKANVFLKEKFKLDNAEQNFRTMKVKTDELGFTHVKLQQVVDSIPVFGNEYLVHFDKDNNVYASNGEFDIDARNYKTKGDFIKAKDAMEIAKKDVGYAEGSEINQEDIITADLYLYKSAEEYIPVYLVRVSWMHEDSFGDWKVMVDAVEGNVVDKFDGIKYGGNNTDKPVTGTNAIGTGTGVLGDTKTINLTLSSGLYYLQDNTRATYGIFTYNANNRTRLPGTLMSDTDTTWNSSVQYAGVDAHYYVGKVYDYYKNIHSRNSLNNAGLALKATVHYKIDYVNAFWNGTQIVFGDGDGVQSLPLSGGFDIVAHELTHGVDSYEADLLYQDQSGALSESFADTLATAAEYYAQPAQFDWLIGEDVWTPAISGDALRSMEDPTLYGDPAHMNDYVYTSADYGGVHTNSGIPNKAAYLVGSNIGVDKMGKIYYRALSTYLISTSDFSDCRAACLQSAADLYGANGTEYNAVVNAFDAVGIY
ncbi:MAG: bacillolysin [Clostridia bacterium]|jgi:Zn-dependent metalloprotease|nr:bacillolysin [Clostridia bacterium]